MKTLLSLDMSSSCTGWALLDIESKKLISYGSIKGKTFSDESPWRATLRKLEYMSSAILSLIETMQPTHIVVEEIAGSKNRISQKTLDMCHGILWKAIDKYLDIVSYYDVSGLEGWRTHLNLRLTEQDKLHNKEAKKLNKALGKGVTRLPIIDFKDLACRYVNERFGLILDCNTNQYDADIADAIAIGDSFCRFRSHELKV